MSVPPLSVKLVTVFSVFSVVEVFPSFLINFKYPTQVRLWSPIVSGYGFDCDNTTCLPIIILRLTVPVLPVATAFVQGWEKMLKLIIKFLVVIN